MGRRFEAELDARDFYALVRLAKSLGIMDVPLAFGKGRLSVEALDVTRTSMLRASVPCRSGASRTFVLDAEQLEKALRGRDGSVAVRERVEYEADSEGKRRAVRWLALAVGGLRFEFKPEGEAERVPKLAKLKLKAEAVVEVRELASKLRAVREFGDVAKFECARGVLAVTTTHIVTGARVRAEVEARRCRGRAKSFFDIDPLLRFLRALGAGEVTLRLGDDVPLKVEFEEGGLRGEYYLAPRLE